MRYTITLADLITGLIITWGVGLALPIILRLFVIKKALGKWKAFGLTFLCFVFNHQMFFKVINPNAPENSGQIAMFLLAFVTYKIFRKGYKQQEELHEELENIGEEE